MYGIIYKLTCLITWKVYVGQTTRTLDERFKEHVSHNKYLIGNAIRKYGAENFSREVLEVCDTQEQLNERERYWIAYFDCIAPKGYNLTEGGEGGFHHTPETRAKIGIVHLGNKYCLGFRHSDKTKMKLSASRKNKRAVICIETGETFDSVAATARHYGVNRSNIIGACKNHQLSVHGLHFWYLEDFNNATEIIIPPAKTNPKKRPVICLETGEVFESGVAAAKWLGVFQAAVSRSCLKHFAVHDHHFRYLYEFQRSQE